MFVYMREKYGSKKDESKKYFFADNTKTVGVHEERDDSY